MVSGEVVPEGSVVSDDDVKWIFQTWSTWWFNDMNLVVDVITSSCWAKRGG